jgi:hypothetical protein
MEIDLETIPIVFTKHARERSKEIGKNLPFIEEKIRASWIYERRMGEKKYAEETHGRVGLHFRNGHYRFVACVVRDTDKYFGKDALLIITVINLNMRKSEGIK